MKTDLHVEVACSHARSSLQGTYRPQLPSLEHYRNLGAYIAHSRLNCSPRERNPGSHREHGSFLCDQGLATRVAILAGLHACVSGRLMPCRRKSLPVLLSRPFQQADARGKVGCDGISRTANVARRLAQLAGSAAHSKLLIRSKLLLRRRGRIHLSKAPGPLFRFE